MYLFCFLPWQVWSKKIKNDEAYCISIVCFSPRFWAAISFMKRAYRKDILLINRFSSIGGFLKVISVRLTTIFIFAMIILLVFGDIETNPGPYTIIKSVQGSFHQGDPRLGTNAGTQCVCNSLFAVAWSAIKNISFWNANDLDLILCEGTKLYGGLGYTNFANRVLPIILVNRSDFTYQQKSSSHGFLLFL